MLIFEYQCRDCFSVFEHQLSEKICCVSCGKQNTDRIDATFFAPHKEFCPHIRNNGNLSAIVTDGSNLCSGCSGTIKTCSFLT